MHLGNIKLNSIIHGDCLEVMKQIPDKSIEMILCDLPFGVTKCEWDSVIPFNLLWESYERIIKDNGVIVLMGQQPFTTDLINSNRKLFKYSMVWVKDKPGNFANARRMPMKYHEDILVFYKKLPTFNQAFEPREGTGSKRTKYIVKGGFAETDANNHKIHGLKEIYYNMKEEKLIGSVIRAKVELRKKGQHPTVKPIKLFEHLIKTYTNEGDIVLDNCIGSGTTAIAAINTGRFFIGIEKEKEYYDIALERIERAKGLFSNAMSNLF